jgi:hypothetical protein
MTLATTKWPLRKIIYGIWFDTMHCFVHSRAGAKDHFETYLEAETYMNNCYSEKEIRKNKISVKPIRRVGQNQIDAEDV